MYDVENELVRQKDSILALVNNGEYERALDRLEFAKELWVKCSYAYKYREIINRMCGEVRATWLDAVHHKTREKIGKLLDELYKVRNDA